MHYQGEEEKFPEIIKDFRNKDYTITLKINAENVNQESDVYEAVDICIQGEEDFASNAAETIPSPSAEDDNTITVIFHFHLLKILQFVPYLYCI